MILSPAFGGALMAVRIRLKRMGSKRRPFYRLVVVDSRGKRDGGFLDQVGHYNPIAKPHELEIDEEKVFGWLKKGAGLSEGAEGLLKQAGLLAKWRSMRSQSAGAEPEPTEEEVASTTEDQPDTE
jgi:small subunit ribosomal protein S16